jgi:hypothetical protein
MRNPRSGEISHNGQREPGEVRAGVSVRARVRARQRACVQVWCVRTAAMHPRGVEVCNPVRNLRPS